MSERFSFEEIFQWSKEEEGTRNKIQDVWWMGKTFLGKILQELHCNMGCTGVGTVIENVHFLCT
jgi:hypothetical protein